MLDKIGVAFATDKSSINHHYLTFYELIFRHFLKYDRVKILEIGIQFGNSLRMWRGYFPQSYIFGIDSVDNKSIFEPPHGITVHFGDAYQQSMIDFIHDHWPVPFHIIIDDGSHNPYDQQFFVSNYSQFISSNGILIVEDVPGMEAIPLLSKAVPEGFHHAVVDLRSVEVNTKDSILFLVWRQ